MKKIKIGDIIEIQNKNGFAYALHTHKHIAPPAFGYLIHVFDRVYPVRPDDVNEILNLPVQFTTFFPIGAAVNQGLVDVVKNVSVPERFQKFPIFRNGNPDSTTKKVKIWSLWDGVERWRVNSLSEEERRYPLLSVITYPVLLDKIENHWTVENDPVWGL